PLVHPKRSPPPKSKLNEQPPRLVEEREVLRPTGEPLLVLSGTSASSIGDVMFRVMPPDPRWRPGTLPTITAQRAGDIRHVELTFLDKEGAPQGRSDFVFAGALYQVRGDQPPAKKVGKQWVWSP